MTRLVCLEVCSGEGGSTTGIMRAGFDVIAVDNDPNRLRRNPAGYKLLGDALDAIDLIGPLVDLIWAGFPCQDYSAGTRAARAHGIPTGHARLIDVGRVLLQATGTPWVIENVEGARSEMRGPITLCGSMFGLSATDDDGTPLVMQRHRLFESSHALLMPYHAKHTRNGPQVAGSYGGAKRNKREARQERHGGYVPAKHVQGALLGVTGMTEKGQYLCIPPVYAEFVANQVKPS